MEDSTRGREVTEQVALLIENDEPLYNLARSMADDPEGLGVELGGQLRLAATGYYPDSSAIVYTARELAPNDYDRINWAEIIRRVSFDE